MWFESVASFLAIRHFKLGHNFFPYLLLPLLQLSFLSDLGCRSHRSCLLVTLPPCFLFMKFIWKEAMVEENSERKSILGWIL